VDYLAQGRKVIDGSHEGVCAGLREP
jgi:hypothetical protein